MNQELPDVNSGFRKGRGTRDQIANIRFSIEKAREFQKNIYFCFIDCTKAFNCVDQNKLWKILRKMGMIKDRNVIDLTEAEDKKRWQEYTEELYKRDLRDPDNHDGEITHLDRARHPGM